MNYRIVSNDIDYNIIQNRTVEQKKQLVSSVQSWQSRTGTALNSLFVPDSSIITNIWDGNTYTNLQNDLNSCITNVFYANQATEWYRDEWNHRWGIPSRAKTLKPIRVTQLTFEFNGRNSDNNGSDGYGIELYGGLGSYGTTKLVSDMDAWYPHNAGQPKSYTITNTDFFDHFMMIVSCRGNSYHDRVGYRNVIIYGDLVTEDIQDISNQHITATENICLIPTNGK
jgi:hypothetical protein